MRVLIRMETTKNRSHFYRNRKPEDPIENKRWNSKCYNDVIWQCKGNKKERRFNRISWGAGRDRINHNYRERVSKKLTEEMTKCYSSTLQLLSFTWIGWPKGNIDLMIEIHIEEWYTHCNLITDRDKINKKTRWFI